MNKLDNMKLFFQLVIVSLILQGCKNKVEKCTIPDTISYKNDVQPLFDANCLTSGCHSGVKPAGNLDLSSNVSYQNLNDSQSGYVDIINPKNSLLYNSMTSVNNPMPPNRKLEQCKLDLILKWIEQGAKNN